MCYVSGVADHPHVDVMTDLACELGYDAVDFRAAMRHLSPWRLRSLAVTLATFDGLDSHTPRGAVMAAHTMTRLLTDLEGEVAAVEWATRHDEMLDIARDVESRAPWVTP